METLQQKLIQELIKTTNVLEELFKTIDFETIKNALKKANPDVLVFGDKLNAIEYLIENEYLVFEDNDEAVDYLLSKDYLLFADIDETIEYLQDNNKLAFYSTQDMVDYLKDDEFMLVFDDENDMIDHLKSNDYLVFEEKDDLIEYAMNNDYTKEKLINFLNISEKKDLKVTITLQKNGEDFVTHEVALDIDKVEHDYISKFSKQLISKYQEIDELLNVDNQYMIKLN